MQAFLRCGAQLGQRHLKISVAGKADHLTPRCCKAGSNRRRHPCPHGAALRGQQAPFTGIGDELGWPDREISGAVGNDRIIVKMAVQPGTDLDHIHGPDLRGVFPHRQKSLATLVAPARPVTDRRARRKLRQQLAGGCAYRNIGLIDFADLGGRNMAVDQRCLHPWHIEQPPAIGCRFAESDIDGQDQIGLTQKLP